MIINSDFKDYYDSIVKVAGRDNKLFYDRRSKHFRAADVNDDLRFFMMDIDSSYEIGFGRVPSREFFDLGLIVFCGKVYPFYRFGTSSRDFEITYEDPFNKFYANFDLQKNPFRRKVRFVDFGCASPVADELNKKYAPVILYHQYSLDLPKPYFGTEITLNPRLATFRFPMHPVQVWQNLSSFVAPQDPDVILPANEYKIKSKGFDNNSFRRDKGGPARKRKKALA